MVATRPPLWLLDFDGVLNVGGRGKDNHTLWPHWERGSAYSYGQAWDLRWSSDVASFIRQVITTRQAEVIWLTTWHGETDLLDRLLGFPPLQSLASPFRGDGWSKGEAAEEFLASERSFIWTDDDLSVSFGRPYARRAKARGGLVIAPRPNNGLVQREIRRIASFLAEA